MQQWVTCLEMCEAMVEKVSSVLRDFDQGDWGRKGNLLLEIGLQ